MCRVARFSIVIGQHDWFLSPLFSIWCKTSGMQTYTPTPREIEMTPDSTSVYWNIMIRWIFLHKGIRQSLVFVWWHWCLESTDDACKDIGYPSIPRSESYDRLPRIQSQYCIVMEGDITCNDSRMERLSTANTPFYKYLNLDLLIRQLEHTSNIKQMSQTNFLTLLASRGLLWR